MGQRLSKRRSKMKAKKARRLLECHLDASTRIWCDDDVPPRQPRQFNSLQDIRDETLFVFTPFDSMYSSLATSSPDVHSPPALPVATKSQPVKPKIVNRTQDTGPITYLLEQCSKKTIGRIANVPVLRVCPSCGALVCHDGGNKYVRCLVCVSEFCFVCLQLSLSSGGRGCADVCAVTFTQKVLHRITENELRLDLELRDSDVTETNQISANIDKLQPLPGFVEISREECCLTMDDTPTDRAKMPCGHVISTEGMKQLCENALSTKHEYQIKCPACSAVWEFFVVRHVLSSVMTPAELMEIGNKMNVNMLSANDVRQCPTCHSYCSREAEPDGRRIVNQVVCPVCTKASKHTKAFCWQCTNIWRGDKSCGNVGCTTTDQKIPQLTKCGVKVVENVRGVPQLRGCAKCGCIIEHRSGCKYMKCRTQGCGYEFCFICLKPCPGHMYTCNGLSCKVAPRQISLPNK